MPRSLHHPLAPLILNAGMVGAGIMGAVQNAFQGDAWFVLFWCAYAAWCSARTRQQIHALTTEAR